MSTAFDEYVSRLLADRADALRRVAGTIRANLPPGYEEGMQYKMPAWYVPHRVYPAGCHADQDNDTARRPPGGAHAPVRVCMPERGRPILLMVRGVGAPMLREAARRPCPP